MKKTLLVMITLFLSLTINTLFGAKKTYIYVWEVPVSTHQKIYPQQVRKDGQISVIYWASPWMVHKHEKINILKSLFQKHHINKGYFILNVDRKLVKDGTIKFGLFKVIGGSEEGTGSR